MRTGVHRSMPHPWNVATGELLPPIEPSRMETAPYSRRLDEALDQVVKSLRPLSATLVAELHAVRAAVTRVTGWRLYDPDPYAELVRSAQLAAALPTLPTYLPLSLETTVGLAADVARNADDSTFDSHLYCVVGPS